MRSNFLKLSACLSLAEGELIFTQHWKFMQLCPLDYHNQIPHENVVVLSFAGIQLFFLPPGLGVWGFLLCFPSCKDLQFHDESTVFKHQVRKVFVLQYPDDTYTSFIDQWIKILRTGLSEPHNRACEDTPAAQCSFSEGLQVLQQREGYSSSDRITLTPALNFFTKNMESAGGRKVVGRNNRI